ncbi:MAG: enoyl-CoA hydratase/isomerase family protein [Pseudochelatococcus sp.]|jgi:enoyl-CoA hydratase|uniref:enoyl-CoA hydratase/isomerase family protein n=1 Tax=Pseudochelatococcus sp. TaxID=2020869 RepID=UPI003D8B41B5
MDDLRIETPADGVRLLVLSRSARRNALSRSLIGALHGAVAAARAEGARAVVIAAEGPVFSAGADFADLDGSTADLAFDDAMSVLTASLRDSAVISIAAIDGACIGAGLDLALACDFRVATPGAVFALPAVRMGILYNPRRLAQILPMISRAAAARLLLLAERLDCAEAQLGGIVTHVTDRPGAEAARDRALALATAAAALPALAQDAAKAFAVSFESPDFKAADWEARRLTLLESDQRREALRQARTKK